MCEVIVVFVNKSVSLDLDDLKKVMKSIKRGESKNLSEYVRKAIKIKLEDDKIDSATN
jgi:DNA polymerase III sliding clamp (beta) subunit (PCNA family)